ncbi:MAG: class II glutamine amidotransferase [Solirubrobacterales bacterium]
MCRVFGAVASAPISVRYELVEAVNPMIRLSEDHDSGWGMAVYEDVGADAPLIERFSVAAHSDRRFDATTTINGRIFNAHVRRATLGGLSAANTHPFDFGPYSFSHNGTILDYRSLIRPGMPGPKGETDSECFFLRLINEFNPADPVRSMRGVVAAIVAGTTFSGLNFLFTDGIRLYAYRLGLFTLYWSTRPGMSMVASEMLTGEQWHTVQQDVLLTLDPESPEDVRAERLLGDVLLQTARIQPLEPDASLRGDLRGQWAARRAQRSVASNGAVPAIARGLPAGEPVPV